jgi:hypothetical protein
MPFVGGGAGVAPPPHNKTNVIKQSWYDYGRVGPRLPHARATPTAAGWNQQ